ncbi:MAG: OadG family protein [Lachnospiraceae bacterium]|nr:OadG family protein [Lachnospiraceae bacterium]
MKKYLTYLLLATFLCIMTACGSSNVQNNEAKAIEYNQAELQNFVQERIQIVSQCTSEEVNELISELRLADEEETEGLISFYENFNNSRDDLGDYVNVLNWDFNASAEEVVVNVKVAYTLRNCDMTLGFERKGNIAYITYSTVTPEFSKEEIMRKAGLNTVIGIGTVFVMLAFMSFLISLLKYSYILVKIHNAIANSAKAILGKGKKENKTEVANAGVDKAIAQIEANEEELADDLELVAVIAAAIAAATGSSTDDFVVRSIRKSTKWKRA